MSALKVLEFQELQRITGYTRKADVEKSLRSQGIKIFLGRKGPWTTLDLINQAGGIRAAGNDEYGPEIV